MFKRPYDQDVYDDEYYKLRRYVDKRVLLEEHNFQPFFYKEAHMYGDKAGIPRDSLLSMSDRNQLIKS